ncbi:MAG: PDZ domain-containing protein [Flavobacterium sp. JAD_PAG50586_2]|nr:MAG: PDZ domain-containing protein [Flavobacterium sp. JAD_PAG50586_2]
MFGSSKTEKIISLLLFMALFGSCTIFRQKHEYFINEALETNLQLNDSITINGIFDTGSSLFCIDSLIVNKLKVKNYFFHNISGVGVSSKKAMIVTDTLKVTVANNHYTSSITTVTDIKRFAGRKLDAILGNMMFSENMVFVSSEQNSLEIIKDSSAINFSEYKKLPYKYINGKLIIDAKIDIDNNLSFNGKFLLDTGFNGQLYLNKNLQDKFNIESKIKKKAYYCSTTNGIGGKSEGFLFSAKSIRFAAFKLDKIAADCTKDTTGAFARNKDFDGMIGHGILKKFDVIFDFRNQVVYLKPGKEFTKLSARPKVGFSFVDRTDLNKGFIVNSIVKESNAEKAGLRLNDEIVVFNGARVENEGVDFIKEINTQKIVKLIVKRGTEFVNITFKKSSLY